MPKFVYLALLIIAVSAVGVADIFLKKATANGATFLEAMKSPWMLGAIFLYLLQIALFTYVFVSGAKLSLVGILQTGLYAAITLGAGVLYFNESLSAVQTLGIVLTIGGVVLLNL